MELLAQVIMITSDGPPPPPPLLTPSLPQTLFLKVASKRSERIISVLPPLSSLLRFALEAVLFRLGRVGFGMLTYVSSPTHDPHFAVCLFVGWLLNVPTAYECISGTDLLRQFYVLLH